MNKRFKFIVLPFTLMVMVLIISSLAAPVSFAAKPPTKTPTPSGGPTATPTSGGGGSTFHVDCSALTNGNGSQVSPWNNFAPVNATTFSAGNSILLKRGTTCTGQQLWPKGSGASGNPITLGAYGTGNRPIVDGNNAVGGATQDDSLVKLFDQQYWVVQDLEIKNSLGNGLMISGSGAATLNFFRILNVYSHNHGTTDDDWCISGWAGGNDGDKPAYPTCLSTKIHEWEVAINVNSVGQGQKWNDVLIDGATTDTAFRGIEFYGPGWNSASLRSTNLTIRNSSASNVQNDGIFVGSVTNALIENNVGFETGSQPYHENHTPNAIWNFGSGSVVFQFNEAYQNHSPDVDGGAFDADYSSNNTTYQYNYGHDNDGYCVSVFGAGGFGADANTNVHVRYNVCSNNNRDGTKPFQGDLYVTAWSAGKITGAHFYNNTVYWNPTTPNSPEYNEGFWAIRVFDIWHGGAVTNLNFYNNIVYSASPDLVSVNDYETGTNLNNNIYWYTGAGSPRFDWGGTTTYVAPHVIDTTGDTVYTSLAAFQAGTGEDSNSIYANPLLNSPTYHGIGMPTTQFTLQAGSPAINAGANLVSLGIVSSVGTRDFFGSSIPLGGAFDIGADELQ